MDLFEFVYLTILSFIQGMTEFLPVSSSAHLLVLPYLVNVADQGIIVDISAHIGSILAVCYFYQKDIKEIFFSIFRSNSTKSQRSLFYKICLAFIPIFIAGAIMYFGKISGIRNPKIVIYTSIIFGGLLYLADVYSAKKKDIPQLSYFDAIFIGLAQIISIIPGVSRSGATMTAGMMCGQKRQSAVRFAFLLSIPTVGFLGVGSIVEFIANPVKINIIYLIFTICMSFIFSLFAIKFMINWVKKSSFKIFAIYRILFAIFLYFYLK